MIVAYYDAEKQYKVEDFYKFMARTPKFGLENLLRTNDVKVALHYAILRTNTGYFADDFLHNLPSSFEVYDRKGNVVSNVQLIKKFEGVWKIAVGGIQNLEGYVNANIQDSVSKLQENKEVDQIILEPSSYEDIKIYLKLGFKKTDLYVKSENRKKLIPLLSWSKHSPTN